MAASDHVSQAQSGKYQFRRNTDYDSTYYHVYKGDMQVGKMEISHMDDDEYDDHEGTPYINKVSLLHMAKGHGLSGLADRVRAADGTLTVDSPAGGPTVIRAELPCG